MNKTVSIIIPSRNEEQYIARCLQSILNQDYPQHLIEVFVCDGISKDRTAEIINDFSAKKSNIQLLINSNRTTPFALNLGINKSSSDIILILGAHAELFPDYVSKCVQILSSNDQIQCTGGILENTYENNTSEAIGMAMSSTFGVGNAHFRTGTKEGFVDTVAFGAYKREIFQAIGLFNEELVRNQDDEFNYRVLKAGFKIRLSLAIKSKYYVRASYSKLIRQYYQYGYWKVYINKLHKTITTLRQLVPLFFVLFLFLFPLSLLIDKRFIIIYMGLITLYIVSAIANASVLSKKLSQVPKIFFAFIVLHISYGAGYLKGLIDFMLLRIKIKKDETITR